MSALTLLLLSFVLVQAQSGEDCPSMCKPGDFAQPAAQSVLIGADTQSLFEPVEESSAQERRDPQPVVPRRKKCSVPAELRGFKVHGFAKHRDFVYGPWKPSGYRAIPLRVIQNFRGARSITDLVAAYMDSINRVEISAEQFTWYNYNVRRFDEVDYWMDSRYIEMDITQVPSELPTLLKDVIDEHMPEPTIRLLTQRVLRCKHGGSMVRFGLQPPARSNRLRMVGGAKIFAATCSDPRKVQLLVFNVVKRGYLPESNLSPRFKRKTLKILNKWGDALFYARFTSPGRSAA